MTRRNLIKTLVGGGVILSAGSYFGLRERSRSRMQGAPEAARAGLLTSSRPNIVFMLADDLGAEGIGAYGTAGDGYHTPVLDSLAAGGIRFENAYATPLCTPSRVQVMSGYYPFRTGRRSLLGLEADFIDPARATFGHILKAAGYHTAVAGKWQLCNFAEQPDHANALGFDEYCLWLWRYKEFGKTSRYWDPGIIAQGRVSGALEGEYGPDVFTDFVTDFIRRKKSEPFFVYYPMVLPHEPFHVTPDRLGKPPRSSNDEIFRDMVSYMDKLVGRIENCLREEGLLDNTLLVFAGDNGSPNAVTTQLDGRSIRGGKRRVREAGARIPLIASWPGTTPRGEVSDALVDFTDILPTFMDLSGATHATRSQMDGTSFAQGLVGKAATERDWVLVNGQSDHFIRDKRFMLRRDGSFYDMENRYSAARLNLNSLSATEQRAYLKLKTALAQLDPDHGARERGRARPRP